MEPISLILAALVAGATAAAKDTAGTAVKDTYEGLKGLIKEKFADNTKAQDTLKDYEQDPETYEKPLKKQLTELGVDKDPQIVDKAKEVMEKEDPTGAKVGKYNTNIGRDFKGIQGDISGGKFHQDIK